MANSNKTETLTALNLAAAILAVMIVGFAAVFVYARFVYEPSADSEMASRYAAVARERLSQHAEELQHEAANLLKEVTPPIAAAVQEEVNEDYGRYVRALEREGHLYVANVEAMLKEKLRAHVREYLLAHRDVVKEEFPEHASDENVEKVLADFERVVHKLAERYYLDEFQRQSERTVALWNRFEPAPLPGPNEPSLHEQLADYAADWAVLAASEAAEAQVAAGKRSTSDSGEQGAKR
jgi:hypothetical protein